jgi:hypothetical protein
MLNDQWAPVAGVVPGGPLRRGAAWGRAALLAATLVVAQPGWLGAQAGAAPDETRFAKPCPDGRITEIWVDNHSVFDLTDPNRSERFDWAFRLANRLHIRTREDVIRRELGFREGDCYDPVLLRESERVLRATHFIAEVDLYGVQQPDGDYHVIVDTRDEWSMRVEPQTGPGTGLQLTGLAVREDNLLGTGQQAAAFYLQDRETRVYGVSYFSPQFLGSRWQAGFALGRTPLGSFFRETVDYPFVGETGRRAFRHHLEHHDRYFGYLVEQDDRWTELLMPERRRSFDLGAARRFGPPGRLTVLGAMVAGEWVSYPGAPRFANGAENGGAPPGALGDPIIAQLDSVADVRAIALFGQRNVSFIQQRALDTVQGTEDVLLGVELELGLGSSIGAVSTANDISLDLGFFAAGQLGSGALLGTRFVLQGKRNYDAPPDGEEWDDVFGQFDAWAYLRPSPDSRHTLVATLAGAGGWNPRVPFQLTLGGATGLRGQPFHLVPGSQRVVMSLEARSYLGWPYPQLFDLGSVAFLDAGRMWAGRVPYGVNSRLYTNVGVGLRAAFPPGSHNTFRLDIAAPIDRLPGFSDFVFSVGTRQMIGRRPRHDPELYRTSRRGSGTSTFRVRTDRE